MNTNMRSSKPMFNLKADKKGCPISANANERKCQISQKPVQKTECQTTNDVEKQCQQVFKDECHSVPEQDQECTTRFDSVAKWKVVKEKEPPENNADTLFVFTEENKFGVGGQDKISPKKSPNLSIYRDAHTSEQLATDNVYFRGYPQDTEKGNIIELFSKFGRIQSIIMNQGYGFARFKHAEDALKAYRALNETEFKGRSLMLKFTRVFRSRDPEATRRYHARRAAEVLAEEELRIAASKKKEESKEVKKEVTKLKVPKIERMINDAKKFTEEDAELKSKVEARNELESFAYSHQNQLSDKEKIGGKLSDDKQSKVEEIINKKIVKDPAS